MPRTFVTLLSDGETFTDTQDSTVVAMDPAAAAALTVEGNEAVLEDGDYDSVIGLSVTGGLLTVHIFDSSGVPVVINDERTDPDEESA